MIKVLELKKRQFTNIITGMNNFPNKLAKGEGKVLNLGVYI